MTVCPSACLSVNLSDAPSLFPLILLASAAEVWYDPMDEGSTNTARPAYNRTSRAQKKYRYKCVLYVGFEAMI